MPARDGARFVAVAALILLAHAAPLAADEAPVPFMVGPATIAVPESWLEFPELQRLNLGALDLAPPLSQVDGFAGIDTTGILKVHVQLRYDRAEVADDWHVAGALENAKETLGIARAEDAALAFGPVPFDALYGGVVTNFGKSGVTALYLLGSVQTEDYGAAAIGAVLSRNAEPEQRYYTIAFLIDLDGEPFVARITIEATRLFGPNDLGWIDLATAVARNRYDFAD